MKHEKIKNIFISLFHCLINIFTICKKGGNIDKNQTNIIEQ